MSEEGIEFLGEGLFGHEAYGLVDGLAAFEEEDGGHVADAELRGEVAALVDVGGAHDGASFIFFLYLLDARGEGFAWAAPCGAEVDHDGFVCADDAVEVFFCDFHNVLF